MAEKEKIKKKYIVVFQDEDNTVLKTAFVPEGDSVQPPELPAKKGETKHYETVFCGWNTDFSKVKSNLVVKAVYKEVPKKYLVMYFHENDRLLGMESVPYGNPAKAEIYPEKKADEEYEYLFEGWNGPLDCIKADINVRAVFRKKRKVFRVCFFHEDGSLLKEEQVEYGEQVKPPKNPIKKQDATYHYLFQGWSETTERVTGDMKVYAVFSSIYNEYTIAFYDENQLLQKKDYHYGDIIAFPHISRKGYDLFWSKNPKKVEESCEIYARWVFSNPAGKEVTAGRGTYRIVNPSVTNGTVVLTNYKDKKSVRITLPDKVKLGDYYYSVVGIGTHALTDCIHMQKLCLPNSVLHIENRGLADCRQMRILICGKYLKSLGAEILAGNVRLREIYLPGFGFRKCHKNAFGSLGLRLKMYVCPANRRRVERALEAVNGRNNIEVTGSVL